MSDKYDLAYMLDIPISDFIANSDNPEKLEVCGFEIERISYREVIEDVYVYNPRLDKYLHDDQRLKQGAVTDSEDSTAWYRDMETAVISVILYSLKERN